MRSTSWAALPSMVRMGDAGLAGEAVVELLVRVVVARGVEVDHAGCGGGRGVAGLVDGPVAGAEARQQHGRRNEKSFHAAARDTVANRSQVRV
jgi:hypothetical protein